MMVAWRQLRYQSHNERVFSTEVNKKIAKLNESRAIFEPRPHSDHVMNSQTTQRSQFVRAKAPECVLASTSDAFHHSCIYNEEREIFAGA